MGDDGAWTLGLARTSVSSASSIMAVDFIFLFFLCESLDAMGDESVGLVASSGVIND